MSSENEKIDELAEHAMYWGWNYAHEMDSETDEPMTELMKNDVAVEAAKVWLMAAQIVKSDG